MILYLPHQAGSRVFKGLQSVIVGQHTTSNISEEHGAVWPGSWHAYLVSGSTAMGITFLFLFFSVSSELLPRASPPHHKVHMNPLTTAPGEKPELARGGQI